MSETTEAKRVTLSGRPPEPGCEENIGAPAPIDPATGMHKDYWILSDEERAKGFVRPVRTAYIHVGVRPKYPTRALTEEELRDHGKYGYVAYEEYPPSEAPVTGRLWTAAQLQSGCQTKTVMGLKLAETYARDPQFYGATFCCHCRQHFPVAEFVWDGTEERVGS